MKQNFALVAGINILLCYPLSRTSADTRFDADIAPVLKRFCFDCHSGAKPKGDLALDQLKPDFEKSADIWRGVMERIGDGTMPPKGKLRPTAAQAKTVADWASAELISFQANKVIRAGRSRLRRLNRIEYANTIRDLLGVDVDIETLPEDGIASGFDNVDGALDVSANLLERYLESADNALEAVFVRGAKPQATKRHIDMAPLARQITKTNKPMPRYGASTQIRGDEVLFLGANEVSKPLLETKAALTGTYRFRIAAHAVRHDKPMTLILYAGNYGMGLQGLMTRPIGMFDVADQPTTIDFTARMMAKEAIRIFPHGLPNLYKKVEEDYSGPGLAIQWVEVEGPLVEVWPPAATTRLLAGVEPKVATLSGAETILGRFATRAFRRPLKEGELAPFLNIVKTRLAKGHTFEEALRVGLKGILCSPNFLYLPAPPGKLNEFDLATRLAYFLWSSTPDDTLAEVAREGKLGQPDILRRQVERMLDDPRAHAFTENFTGQWLSLRNLKATIPDKKLYPDFDEFLEMSMTRETYLFFEEILAKDLSVLDFVHADWSMLNGRLATLYKIADVHGSGFRKVTLPPGSHRGGVMTQSAVLRVTANGTNTSPVTRGVWVLDRILGTPAPPPPQDVPAIEPDIRGAKTIREQLAKHREIASCANCHAKIDPAGNALENFDVIGGWREYYRVVPGMGRKAVKIAAPSFGREVGVGKGPPVQASDELPDGRKFANVDGFKKLIMDNPDQFARNLTQRLLVYATGHGIELADRAAVDMIVADVRSKRYGFRTMIHGIVQSAMFRNK